MWKTCYKILKYMTIKDKIKYRVFVGYVSLFGNRKYPDGWWAPYKTYDTFEEASAFVKQSATFKEEDWEFDQYGEEIFKGSYC